ncbi:hypothetical protein RFI_31533 [Reticulomyxa filosa]|uniref:Uncharacterized protein n=1 Tax=Reticulomyxa filosa TaxID=46433 RepID=X6LVD8_RETFI|nr:hypothetical protein RFI_31533 [Reticulomyxa filosa]|eukprot:ETO05863.1 hypothetical protein RFI_31533 [Reticulomyxa filosa]
MSVKYGSNELINTILSGSNDKSVLFNGHTNYVSCVEYSPFVVNNIEIGGNSNVICSGSFDNTLRFWDIRSNKKELYVINGKSPITCIKFIPLKKNEKNNENTKKDCGYNLCYGSFDRSINIWGETLPSSRWWFF